jgi:hypothetical protein
MKINIRVPLTPDSALVAIIMDASDWTKPFIAYLKHKILPKDENEALMTV